MTRAYPKSLQLLQPSLSHRHLHRRRLVIEYKGKSGEVEAPAKLVFSYKQHNRQEGFSMLSGGQPIAYQDIFSVALSDLENGCSFPTHVSE